MIHSILRAWQLALILLVCVIGALGSGGAGRANAQTSCPVGNGNVLTTTYRSAIMRAEMRYTLYLPPCYDQTTQPYPVLYLMHGSNSDDTLWLELGIVDALNQGIRDGVLPPMIVVLPYGDWIANTNRFDNLSWSNVFLTELMPAVESAYRVDARRERRAIGGISRGGFWAFNIAYRHPDRFGAVGGHSPFFSLENAPNRYNPLFLSRDQAGIEILRIWLDRGKNDYAFWGIDVMHKWLTRRGVAHSYTVNPVGEHTNDYWRSHVSEYLAFYTMFWPKPPRAVGGSLTSMGGYLTPLPPLRTGEGDQDHAAQGAQGAGGAGGAGGAPLASLDRGGRGGRLRLAGPINTLFVPAVAFPSLIANLPRAQLLAIRAGQPDPALILDRDTLAALTALGVKIAPDVRVVEPGDLVATLWREREAYTLVPFDRLSPRLRLLRVDETLPIDYVADEPEGYPLAFHSAAPNYDPAKLTRFLLSGVTAITRLTMEAIDENGIAWAGEAIRPYTTRADFFHISNEVSFHRTCSARARVEEKAIGPFCSKLYSADLLTLIGVDIVELSGNHNLDFGVRPYLETLALYHERGMRTVGGGATLAAAQTPLVVEHAGARIGMLACNWAGPQWALAAADRPGAAWCDRAWLQAAIPDLRRRVDFLIVSVQYKETDQIRPPNQQLQDFRDLAALGADVVIGSQAHLTQAFEFYPVAGRGEAFLHHGPGNLFFDQVYLQKRFFIDMLLIYDKRLLAVDLFAGITDESGRPRPMEEKERTFFMRTVFRDSLW
jgi:poly-gamma-glutamate synthesis protein (capsule biosynthesis protein)